MLQLTSVSILFIFMISCTGCRVLSSREPLRALYETERIVLCRPAGIVDDKILVFEAGDTVASGRVGIRQVVDEIVNGERKAEYPGIGQWAELLLLDGNNDPIAYVSLVIHGATAVVSRCDRRGDRYFFDLTKRSHSPIRRAGAYQLTRMMYDYLEKNRPEKFAAMNAAYAVHGISIEEVLRAEEKRRNGEH